MWWNNCSPHTGHVVCRHDILDIEGVLSKVYLEPNADLIPFVYSDACAVLYAPLRTLLPGTRSTTVDDPPKRQRLEVEG